MPKSDKLVWNGKTNLLSPPLTKTTETKSIMTGSINDPMFAALMSGNSPEFTYSYERVINEGYNKCVVVAKCIKLRADAVSQAKWEVHRKSTGKEVKTHPVLKLLNRPNLTQSGPSFLEEMQTYKDIDGNTFIHAVGRDSINGGPKQLELIRPDRMTIKPGPMGVPLMYIMDENKPTQKIFRVNQTTGYSEILHIKHINPRDSWRGQSLLVPAWTNIQIYNAGAKHNKKSLDNGARLSGLISFDKDVVLTPEQVANLEERIASKYQGSDNSGKVLIATGGMDYKTMSQSMRDMEYTKSRDVTSREIALAFSVPPILLNIGGDATYANLREARLDFYETVVMSELAELTSELNHWLMSQYNTPNMSLELDLDSIPALEPKQDKLWDRANNATFITNNEKREMVGYEAIEEPVDDTGEITDDTES